MVTARLGASRLGCLFTLLVLAAIGYFGVNISTVFLRYYRFQDAMEQEARFSATKSDAEIRRSLSAVADTLGLPESAHRLTLRRRPPSFTVSADYVEQVELPLFVHDFHFHPHAELIP